jgi:guanylate kinase
VGKGTLIQRLFASHPDTFTLSVSHTTRAPRSGEAHGVDYFYVSMGEFEGLIAKDGFVEHAKFGSNRYGTSKATIEEQTAKGKVVVLDIEMEVGSSCSFLMSTISHFLPTLYSSIYELHGWSGRK